MLYQKIIYKILPRKMFTDEKIKGLTEPKENFDYNRSRQKREYGYCIKHIFPITTLKKSILVLKVYIGCFKIILTFYCRHTKLLVIYLQHAYQLYIISVSFLFFLLFFFQRYDEGDDILYAALTVKLPIYEEFREEEKKKKTHFYII